MAAQCNGDRVNLVTTELFQYFPDTRAIAQANPAQIEAILRPLSFFGNKTQNIIPTCRLLVEHHSSEVPQEIEELI